MSVRDIVSEAEAATMMDWTAAGLRCHRLAHDAHLIGEELPADLRKVMAEVHHGPWAPSDGVTTLRLLGLRLVKAVGDQQVRHTRLGANVGRRLRCGPGLRPPAVIKDRPGPVHYRLEVVREWLDQHPWHRDRAQLMGETISHNEAAVLLDISPMTLRSYRSKAASAVNPSVADRCPPPVRVGFDVRFRVTEIDEWLVRKGRVACGTQPLPPQGPRGPRCPVVGDAPVAKLGSDRSQSYQIARGGTVSFKER